MTTDVERRLRRDLGRLDEIDLPPFDPGAARAADVVTQTPRRSPLWLSIAAAMLLVIGGAGIWLAVSRNDTAPTSSNDLPLAPEAGRVSGFGDDLPLIFDVEVITGSPLIRREGATTVWSGDLAIAMGGTENPDEPSGQPLPVVAFDPDTNEFDVRQPAPDGMAPFGQIIAATDEGILVVGGGHERATFETTEDRTRNSYRYDAANDAWSEIASAPEPTHSGDPWAVADGRLLVWPHDGKPVAYDADDDKWKPLPAPPGDIEPTSASAWTGTEWIIATPHNQDLGIGGVAYSPSGNSWRVISEKDSHWRPANASWNGEEVIVSAGYTSPDVAAYDPASDSWRPLADRPQHPGFQGIPVDRYLVGTFKGTYVTLDPAAGSAGRWTYKPASIRESVPYTDLVWTGDELIGITSGPTRMMKPITQPPCGDGADEGTRGDELEWSDFIVLSFDTFERDDVASLSIEQLGPPIGEVCRRLNDTDADPDVHKVQVGEAGDLPKGTRIHVAPIGPPSEQVVAVLPDDTTVSYSAIDR